VAVVVELEEDPEWVDECGRKVCFAGFAAAPCLPSHSLFTALAR